MDVRDVFRFLGRCGEADLRRGGEVFKDFAPSRIFGGAAAMALIDHDQIEELARELAEYFLPLLGTGDCLVKPEIDFVGSVDPTVPTDCSRQIDDAAVITFDSLGVGR